MKTIMKTICPLFCLLLPVLSFDCLAYDDGDFQYWNSESVTIKEKRDWKLSVAEEFRFGDNSRDFYYQHSDAGLSYSGMTGWLDVSAHYRHIYEEKKEKWMLENRPYLDVTAKWSLLKIGFSNRGRVEYRIREKSDNVWRYTNKVKAALPLKLKLFNIQPYASDEIFYDFDKNSFDKNRVSAGAEMSLSDNIKGDVYYMLESSKGREWDTVHVLGTALTLIF